MHELKQLGAKAFCPRFFSTWNLWYIIDPYVGYFLLFLFLFK